MASAGPSTSSIRRRTRRRRGGPRCRCRGGRLEAPRHRAQQLVAGGVAVRVVDDLKRSRSRNITAKSLSGRRSRARGPGASRSVNSARLGRPVSGSCRASWSRRSSSCLRSVTSWRCPATPAMAPCSSRQGANVPVTQRTAPVTGCGYRTSGIRTTSPASARSSTPPSPCARSWGKASIMLRPSTCEAATPATSSSQAFHTTQCSSRSHAKTPPGRAERKPGACRSGPLTARAPALPAHRSHERQLSTRSVAGKAREQGPEAPPSFHDEAPAGPWNSAAYRPRLDREEKP